MVKVPVEEQFLPRQAPFSTCKTTDKISAGGGSIHVLAEGGHGRDVLIVLQGYFLRKGTAGETTPEPAGAQSQRGEVQDDGFHQVAVIFQPHAVRTGSADNEGFCPTDEPIGAESAQGGVVLFRGGDELKTRSRSERTGGQRIDEALDLLLRLHVQRLILVSTAGEAVLYDLADGF